jgi:hypothetical protein
MVRIQDSFLWVVFSGGLEGGNDGGFRCLLGLDWIGMERCTGLDVLWRLGCQTLKQQGDHGFGLLRCNDFGARREDAEGWIDDDLFYCLVLDWGFGA